MMYHIEIFNRTWWDSEGRPAIGPSKIIKMISGTDRMDLMAKARKLCQKYDNDIFLRGREADAKQWEKTGRCHEWRWI